MDNEKIRTYRVFVLKNNSRINAVIKKDYSKQKLILEFRDKKYETGFDSHWFKTLRNIDKIINGVGYQILCNGTSKYVGVIGFVISMGDGSQCYYNDPKAKRQEKMKLIDTFDYKDWNEYVTEEEQRISFFGKEFVDFMKLTSEERNEMMKELKKSDKK